MWTRLSVFSYGIFTCDLHLMNAERRCKKARCIISSASKRSEQLPHKALTPLQTLNILKLK